VTPAPMKIELLAIGKVTPYDQNARKITPEAIDKVAASIHEFGWRQPIVVDAEFVVIAGHTRLEAARKLGLKRVPVLIARDLTPAQAKAYRLMDNRSHQEATWDAPQLAEALAELQAEGASLELTGFDPDEVAAFLENAAAAATPPEEFPEYDEAISIEHECINCGYRWSGKSSRQSE
jgi:ParB-like chromosome segregation protein Spo0J